MAIEIQMKDEKGVRRYRGEMGRAYHESKRDIPEAAYPWIAKLRAQKIQPYVDREDVVFEFGAGSGWNLARLQCRRKIGYDASEFLRPVLIENGIESIEDPSMLEGESCDVILCHHTLEHLLHPAETLVQLKHWLKKGGKLLVFVPFEKESRYRRFRSEDPDHHLFSWNLQTLGNLLQELDFHVMESGLSRYGQERMAAVLAERFRLGESGFHLFKILGRMIKRQLEIKCAARK